MIEVNQLKYTYPGNKEKTIDNISFKIEKGEIFGFLGPSGAGKSTTLNVLIGILKNYSGSVKVLNQELQRVDEAYYEKIGVAFELPNFYSKFTALENLSFFSTLYNDKTADPNKLLELVDLQAYGNKRVADYSKGMKMRLNLCRALLNNPEVLFLDEPTSGLDPVNAQRVKEIIRTKKSEGKTIFITTHNMNVAEELCDRVAFIVDGKICLIDSPRELKLNNGKKIVKIEYKENNKVHEAEYKLENIIHNAQFVQLMKDKNVERIHTQEATLEDIFIKVTGRSLV